MPVYFVTKDNNVVFAGEDKYENEELIKYHWYLIIFKKGLKTCGFTRISIHQHIIM
jgi:hypothetical protein